ncbi:MAG: DNA ligase D [Tatlockia sp.]|nr:DNA ligase D [Tatlockia sp.]
MGLNQYHKKRDFSKTSEPKGKVAKDKHRLYIIQKHAASHLHYDFRIELKGVLKSWAVPKGPSLDPKVKRLAMHVEDHPIEYGSFEGIIPKGQYGGGTVMLWDEGLWIPLDEHPYKAYVKGHLRFELQGEKLKGRWDLIRFKEDNHWFLIKFQDEYADPNYDITTELDTSVVTQQTIEEIAKNYDKIWSKEGVEKIPKKKPKNLGSKPHIKLPKGLSKSLFPTFIPPELATLVDKPPKGEQWLYEIKFDGYRILSFKKGDEVTLKSRNNKDWTLTLEPVATALKDLAFDNLILDGEVVALDSKGHSNFQLLQNSIKDNKETSLVYFLFDILYFEHYDLRALPLIERKAILKKLISADSSLLHFSDHLIKEGNQLFDYACEQGLEGIIAKKTDSAYLSKRTKNWLKIKCLKRQEFIIGGYTPPKGGRSHFGSLFLGVYNKKGHLEFAGNVGTGFNEASLKDIYQQLVSLSVEKNPFSTNPPGYRQAKWVKPKLVCEVEFTEWTKENHLRHPSFKGLRVDKKASEVVCEEETPIQEIREEVKPMKKPQKEFNLTNPTKILYPQDKITKEDLLRYYETVSDYILPFVQNRPITLVRCPSNFEECFYQRHYNKTTAKTLYPIDVESDKEVEEYIYLKDKPGLFGLVQMGVLEIHPWGSKINHLEQPDIIVIDLDPAPDVPWQRVVAAAKEIRDYLAQYHLISFVKTTGGKGLHVVIPIKPEYDWEAVKEFTHVFVRFLEKLKPDEYISKMTKSKRVGKIFVDYLRNQRSATAIAVYSTRARIHAPVSTPLAWDELSNKMEDNYYTIKTLPKRLEKLKEDPWSDFWKIKQSLRLNDL